jgi:hypothetical protein
MRLGSNIRQGSDIRMSVHIVALSVTNGGTQASRGMRVETANLQNSMLYHRLQPVVAHDSPFCEL